jgi:hypothetical protein
MRSRLEPIDFRQGQVLCRFGAPIEHLYFINRGHPHTPDWLKMKNPACAVVKREAEED